MKLMCIHNVPFNHKCDRCTPPIKYYCVDFVYETQQEAYIEGTSPREAVKKVRQVMGEKVRIKRVREIKD